MSIWREVEMAAESDQSWIMAAFAGMGALFSGVSAHLYTNGASRSKAIHRRIDETQADANEKFARKDVVAEAVKGLMARLDQGSLDHRIMSEKFDELAQDFHILAGQVREHFSSRRDVSK